MYLKLLDFLRCPSCQARLKSVALEFEPSSHGDEITSGLLHCLRCEQWFPIARGIPRMLPDSLQEHWATLEPRISGSVPPSLRPLIESAKSVQRASYDQRTRKNFSHEWENHELGGKTWGMQLSDRVQWFLLETLRIPVGELRGKVMLDAGCGNGSQSVAYTELGLEVIAMDLSSGLEYGYAYRHLHRGANPALVHFVQGDLQRPPLSPASMDIIHSAGVLHHTPDTLQTFRALRPLLRPGGTFYVWLYKYEKWVTPLVNMIRFLTTAIPATGFSRVAKLMAVPFIGFCEAVNVLGIRSYSKLNRREAALALMDIFGAPYAHYHSFDEVAGWYNSAGFTEVWPCNDGRRGFGVCGRFATHVDDQTRESTEQRSAHSEPPNQATPSMQGKSA